MAKQKSAASILKEKKYFENEIEKSRRQIYFHQTIQKVAKQGLKETEAALKKLKIK